MRSGGLVVDGGKGVDSACHFSSFAQVNSWKGGGTAYFSKALVFAPGGRDPTGLIRGWGERGVCVVVMGFLTD